MARLVDTSVFIELERRERPLEALEQLAHGERVALASITASELLVGVQRARSTVERERRARHVEAIIAGIPIIDFDLAAAEVHAVLVANLQSIGQSVGSHDLIIAATALSRGYDVLTLDVRHFGRIPGLVAVVPAG